MSEFDPIGMRDIDSTPQPTAASTTPAATSDVAMFVACWDEPHCESTVVAAVSSGRPAVSQAVRVTLKDCSPTWLTQPPTTWPTSFGSTPARRNSSFWTWASSSTGWMVDRPPPRRPTGVRTASTMTTSLMSASVVVGADPLPADKVCRAAAPMDRLVLWARGSCRARSFFGGQLGRSGSAATRAARARARPRRPTSLTCSSSRHSTSFASIRRNCVVMGSTLTTGCDKQGGHRCRSRVLSITVRSRPCARGPLRRRSGSGGRRGTPLVSR